MNSGPEPDGWELLRDIEALRDRIHAVEEEIAHRFLSGDDLRSRFAALNTRLSEVEEDYITREASDAHDRLLEDRVQANSDRMGRTHDALAERVTNIEKHKENTSSFRRAVFIAVITSAIAATTTIVITLIHIYG